MINFKAGRKLQAFFDAAALRSKIDPPAVLLVFFALSAGLHFLFPVKRIIYFPYAYLGTILILAGLAVNIWCDALFKRYKTTVKPGLSPTRLLTTGPFCFSRHPMYLGMVVILLGLDICLGSISAFFLLPVFIIIIQRVYISFEEQNLKRTFGRQYLEYRQALRRWL